MLELQACTTITSLCSAGIQARALCMIGKQSFSRDITPALPACHFLCPKSKCLISQNLYSDCIAHHEHLVVGIVCYSGHKFQSSSGYNLCPSVESRTTPPVGLLASTSESTWELVDVVPSEFSL